MKNVMDWIVGFFLISGVVAVTAFFFVLAIVWRAFPAIVVVGGVLLGVYWMLNYAEDRPIIVIQQEQRNDDG